MSKLDEILKRKCEGDDLAGFPCPTGVAGVPGDECCSNKCGARGSCGAYSIYREFLLLLAVVEALMGRDSPEVMARYARTYAKWAESPIEASRLRGVADAWDALT